MSDDTPLEAPDEDLVVWDESDLGPALPGEQSKAALLSEVDGLRSRVQILRAERTAMAGKKYALEVMLEGTQAKVQAMDELLKTSRDPAPVQLEQLRELVHQALLVAEGRGSSGDGLEAERLAQLEAMNTLETKYAELKERAAGYRSERDALRTAAGKVERELNQKLANLAEARKLAVAERDAARARLDELEAQLAAAGTVDRERAERMEQILAQAAQDATLLERAASALKSRASGLRTALAEVEPVAD